MFENELALKIDALDAGRRTWIEDESRAVGRVGVPEPFWRAMCAAPTFAIDVPIEDRVVRLVRTYGEADVAERRRLVRRDPAPARLRAPRRGARPRSSRGEIAEAARAALHYYDRAYDHALKRSKSEPVRRLAVEPGGAPDSIASARSLRRPIETRRAPPFYPAMITKESDR